MSRPTGAGATISPPAPVVCRLAASSERDEAAHVWWSSATSMDGGVQTVPPLAALRARIDDELEAGWRLILAHREGAIVGTLALKPDSAVLDQLFILPQAQGTGVGTALLAEARCIMPRGFTLWTAAANAAARRFYERSGVTLSAEGPHPRDGYVRCHYDWRPETRS